MTCCNFLGLRPQRVLLAIGVALGLSACGGGGGGGDGDGTDVEEHPVPGVTAITPSETLAGGGELTITVSGSNFVDNAVLRWNGVDLVTALGASASVERSTTSGFATELTATVAAEQLASAAIVDVTVFNPAPGGGESSALSFTIANPPPSPASLAPASVIAGAADVTLTIDGNGFVADSVVRWNGADRPTSFISPARLQADIPASDVAQTATVDVTVFSPAPGGGVAAALAFTVDNPAPQLSSLNPTRATEGDGDIVLAVSGVDFNASSIVRWNGSDRITRLVSDTLLEADITSADLATAGSADVTVFNPAPGGGESAGVSFTIDPAIPSPVPTLTSAGPRNVDTGTASAVITLTGTGFVANSLARWNGADRSTSFISDTVLTVTLDSADMASAGIGTLTVFNRSPGGGLSGPQSLFVLESGTDFFYDGFERADGPSVGNGWTEKYAPAFSLSNGRLDSIATTQDYKDSIVYRPQSEDQLDVDLSIEFIRRGPLPGENGFPQLHARVQRNTITTPNTLESYIFFIEDFYLTPTAMIAVQPPLTGEFECYLIDIPLSEVLQTDERYRLRFQVTGTDPVNLTGSVEWFTGGLWQSLGTGSINHVAGMPLDPDLFCAQGAVPDPIPTGGGVGFAKWQGVTDFYDTFHWNEIGP